MLLTQRCKKFDRFLLSDALITKSVTIKVNEYGHNMKCILAVVIAYSSSASSDFGETLGGWKHNVVQRGVSA